MFNKRNPEVSHHPAVAVPVRPEPPRPEPVRSEPARPELVRSEPAPPVHQAVIGSSMRINGDIVSQEPLLVEGEVQGSVQLLHSLTVGKGGKIRANIKARDVTIFGSVEGNVEVNGKIAIRENGTLIGDIRSAGIVIDDGAYFKGSIDIVRPATAKPGKPGEGNGKAEEKAKPAVAAR